MMRIFGRMIADLTSSIHLYLTVSYTMQYTMEA